MEDENRRMDTEKDGKLSGHFFAATRRENETHPDTAYLGLHHRRATGSSKRAALRRWRVQPERDVWRWTRRLSANCAAATVLFTESAMRRFFVKAAPGETPGSERAAVLPLATAITGRRLPTRFNTPKLVGGRGHAVSALECRMRPFCAGVGSS